MTILVFGETGQVARELARRAPEAEYLGRAQADLAMPQACAAAIHDRRPSADIGQLTPPQLPPGRQITHDGAAASRNDAKSPHTSASSSARSLRSDLNDANLWDEALGALARLRAAEIDAGYGAYDEHPRLCHTNGGSIRLLVIEASRGGDSPSRDRDYRSIYNSVSNWRKSS